MYDEKAVLTRLLARLTQAHDDILNTSSLAVPTAELAGRMWALNDIATWIGALALENSQEVQAVFDRAETLRANCLKLARMYQELIALNTNLIPRLPPERRLVLEAQQPLLQVAGSMLTTLAAANSPAEAAAVDASLEGLRSIIDLIKAAPPDQPMGLVQ